ncbi:RNA polymerase sigma factor [Nostocoides sp. Soil756]|jgi:RNA polymerase sigma-70 factor (ECF subfamily)|uniref:RNA polymerase sigma factor n=1 Tax=Nostocoides sp. Soil756 TaxID=1736399 RepID=UPI0009EA3B63|nr:RNA polymerase sigma factor [Tetrasphaera sp. Soil756]
MDADGQNSEQRAEDFTRLFEDSFDDVFRFCARRAPVARAEDIAAEALATAWRRFETLPVARSDQRAWLFTTARHILLRDERNEGRRRAFTIALGPGHLVDVPGVDGEAATRADLGRAWARLSSVHQEALALTVWEGLSAEEAASVLDISPVAYRLRLSRARKVLRAQLGVPSRTSQRPRPHPTARKQAPEATP